MSGQPDGVITPAERLTTVLACLAVDRRIGGVLFVDLPEGWLTHMSRWLSSALATPGLDTPADAEVVTLGSTESDDDLWWHNAPRSGRSAAEGGSWLLPVTGPLVDPPDGTRKIVVIHDLARASLAVTRAAVVLVGAEAAVADRYGQHIAWQPRARWLAACSRSGLSRLSRHLLDRFPVRIDAADTVVHGSDPRIMRAALDSSDETGFALLNLPPPDIDLLRTAAQESPRLTSEAVDLVISTVGDAEAPARRDLALGRIARALAALDSSGETHGGYVRRAAALMGMAPARDSRAPSATPPEEAVPAVPLGPAAPVALRQGVSRDVVATVAVDNPGPVSLEALTVAADLLSTGIYPEDQDDWVPEYASLREPWQQRSKPCALRGPAVGTEPTQILLDISIPATAFEAAKYQPIRRARLPNPGAKVLIYGQDLRRFRRQPRANTAMVFVLDHTCHRGWDWSAALAPYLRWAYTQRAALTMIEFGHRSCADELRAEAYRATSALDQRLATSLTRSAGRASPLAYALDLAVQELRRQLRYGLAAAERAWLVVVSDGRGNVPLPVSQRGQLSGPVGGEGVLDALAAAAAVRSLPTVRSVVLAPPGLTHCKELPFDLAEAMGGIVAESEQ